MAVAIFAFVLILKLQAIVGIPQVPCYFIFGDSLVDNGNNNHLVTIAKANYPPYGLDFFGGLPTGRFTNGRNLADFLAEFLGFRSYIPPYAAAKSSDITKGVNYGSGAAGILHRTGAHVGQRYTFNKQLRNHKRIVSRLKKSFRNRSSAEAYLSKCLYTVGIGNDDYINNYFLPKYYKSSRLYTPDQFANILIQHFAKQLKTLYSHGARKIAVFGISSIGCTPAELGAFGSNGSPCVNSLNAAVQLFNFRLKPLIDNLNNKLPGSKFIYINTTSISSTDPRSVGIKFINTPCCIVSQSTGECLPAKVPCSNRTEYVFFDGFHPTEIVNFGLAQRSYTALLPSDAYPYDIRHLALL